MSNVIPLNRIAHKPVRDAAVIQKIIDGKTVEFTNFDLLSHTEQQQWFAASTNETTEAFAPRSSD